MHNDTQASRVDLFVDILSEVISTYIADQSHADTATKEGKGEGT